MTVRAILNSKGHQVLGVEPDAKLSTAIKMLSERRIGAVLVMKDQHLEGILSERDIVRVLGERGAGVLDEPIQRRDDAQGGDLQGSRYGQLHHGNHDIGQVQASAGDRRR